MAPSVVARSSSVLCSSTRRRARGSRGAVRGTIVVVVVATMSLLRVVRGLATPRVVASFHRSRRGSSSFATPERAIPSALLERRADATDDENGDGIDDADDDATNRSRRPTKGPSDATNFFDLPEGGEYEEYEEEAKNESSFANAFDDENERPSQRTLFDEDDEDAAAITVQRPRRGAAVVDVSAATMDFYVRSSSGDGVEDPVERSRARLAELEAEIAALNDGVAFNVNSPRQVAAALFGEDAASESTSRDVLEAIAGTVSHVAAPMARLVLEHRRATSALRRRTAKRDRARERRDRADSDDVDEAPRPRDPLLLVDVSALVYRSYFAMPPLHRADGTPVGAVLGVCNTLHRLVLDRLVRGERPRLVFVFDPPSGRTFRHDAWPEYKAHRPPCPVDLVPQFDLVRDLAVAHGVPCAEKEGYEADDVATTLATEATRRGVDVSVVTGDKDLWQLVTPPGATPSVTVTDPVRGTTATWRDVEERWGVTPDRLGDLLALAGDAADNVPGVPGVGPKTAAALLREFGNLTALLEGAARVPQKGRRERLLKHKETALLSRRLVELDRAVPLEDVLPVDDVADLRMEPLDEDRVLRFCDDVGLRDLKRRVANRFRAANRTFTEDAPHDYDHQPAGRRFSRTRHKKPRAVVPPNPADFEEFPF